MIYKGGMPIQAQKVRRHIVPRVKISRQQDYKEQLENIQYQQLLIIKEALQ